MNVWTLYLIVGVLGFVIAMYVIVGIVSWIFKALLVAFFILFVIALFKIRRRSRHKTTTYR